MEFLYPNAFFLLIFPLILFLFLLFKKQNSFKNHFSKEVLEKITISNNFMNKNIRNSLLIFSLFMFILSIARPVMDEKEHKVQEDLIPIIIAIDVSKSMLANDIYPNRLSLAKQKLLKIIENSKQSALGVVLFAKSAFVLSPLTQDFTSLTYLVNNLDSGLNFDNGSNMLAMIEASNDLLENYGSKNIILLSDGGNKDNYNKEIEFATTNKIKIYTIAIATNKQSPIPIKEGYLTDSAGKIVTVGLNTNIAKLGMQSGGGYIDFSLNSNDINAILNDISSEAKKEHMNSTRIKTYSELFYYPLALSLILMLICFSSFPSRNRQVLGLAFLLFTFSNSPMNASILDFQILNEAKESYENKQFKQAEEFYKKVNKNAQTNYNLANSLYKQGKYKEALEGYKNINTQDKDLEYQTLHNMGNTYVKQNDLQNAQTMYEKALTLSDNTQTKENLEAVKKAIKQNKNKDNKNKDDSKDNKKDQDKKDQDKKDEQKNKDKNEDKKKDSKEEKTKQDKEKNKENQSKKENDKKNQDKKNKTSEQNKSEELKNQKLISDMEEKKWLNKIKNQKNQTFLRKVESKSEEENIKNPW